MDRDFNESYRKFDLRTLIIINCTMFIDVNKKKIKQKLLVSFYLYGNIKEKKNN